MPSSHSTTSQIALGLVLSLTSLGIGYQFGTLVSSSSSTVSEARPEASMPLEQEPLLEELDEGDSEDIPDGDLGAVCAGWTEPCKMVLVVRTDLKMTPGTIASQLSFPLLLDSLRRARRIMDVMFTVYAKQMRLLQHWELTGQAKIALKGKSEDQILELQAIAKSLNLCARAATDRELGEDVRTVLAIGPAPVNLVNEVTGKLRLL